MVNAREVYQKVMEALADSHPVFLTDGTVTRKVERVELYLYGAMPGTLDVLLCDGNGKSHWAQLSVEWPSDELDGYGLTVLNGDIFIAPNWWISI